MSEHSKRVIKRASEADRLIGLRLAYIRRANKMQQVTLASKLGLTPAQLSTVESGRIALRLLNGWTACKLFDTHPHWLCYGDRKGPFPILDRKLDAYFEKALIANKNTVFSLGWPSLAWVLDENKDFQSQAIKSVQIPNLSGVETKKTPPIENKSLTNVISSDNSNNVKTEMQQLLDRLNKATADRGMKVALARFMGVPLPSISFWLSGAKEPGGQTTLKLLKWVEEQEAKK